LHANNQFPADTGATTTYILPMGVEPNIKNEELTPRDVDVDKSAWVDVQLLTLGVMITYRPRGRRAG